jgi:hypothetical protein
MKFLGEEPSDTLKFNRAARAGERTGYYLALIDVCDILDKKRRTIVRNQDHPNVIGNLKNLLQLSGEAYALRELHALISDLEYPV